MIEAGMALLWLLLVAAAVGLCGLSERRARLVRVSHRRDLVPPRRSWGGELDRPPASWFWARALAAGARAVRSRSVVSERSVALRRLSRVASLWALSSALALVPFAGTWGGAADGRALVVLDLESGLLALPFLMLVFGLAQVMHGLSDRSEWSRLAAVRIAGRGLVGLALLVLVLAALVIETGSLRLHDLVLAQRESFAPLAWLSRLLVDPGSGSGSGAGAAAAFDALRLPGWLLLRQPLTALLFVPAVAMSLRGAPALDERAGTLGVTGLGLDDDPLEQRHDRLEARLASVLGAALFVALFLGAGAIPYVSSERAVLALEPFVGRGLPSTLMVLVESGVFLLKLALVIALGSRLRAASAVPRNDQWMHETLRRLVPLAWANLLLLAALWQLALGSEGPR